MQCKMDLGEENIFLLIFKYENEGCKTNKYFWYFCFIRGWNESELLLEMISNDYHSFLNILGVN